jgi:hypothetical protein
MSTSIGTANGVLAGVAVNLNNPTLSFAVSPRIGIDINIGDGFLVGVEGVYTTTSGTANGSASAVGLAFPISESFTRSWFAGQARIGARF